ncbi:unnamed protein product [Ixodes hexagonus]
MDFGEVVERKIFQAESLIREIQGCRRSLEENAATVKKEIETSFEQQAVYLRQRGVQLCRQVEVLASHQESRFQLDLAKLHQFMGSMRSLLQLHASGKLTDTDPTHLAYQINMPQVSVTMQRVQFANSGELQLSEAVRNFGGAELQCGRLPSLDVAEEDYGDISHHVLHKDLHHMLQRDPDLPGKLAGQGAASHLPPSDRRWLLNYMDSDSTEDDFELVPSHFPKSSSGASSSIEAVSMDEAVDDIVVMGCGEMQGGLGRLTLEDKKEELHEDMSKWLYPAVTRGPAVESKKESVAALTRDFEGLCADSPASSSKESCWLFVPKGSAAWVEPQPPKSMPKDQYEWLLDRKCKPVAASSLFATTIKEMFRPYFLHTDNSRWIAKGKDLA